jgi:protein glucosyltransferase
MRARAQFLAEHVQMADVRLYIRDALRAYARLQRFLPRPSWNAECYTGEKLLEQFGFPHAFDRQAVLAAYPWLAGYGGEACAGKLPRRVVEKDEVRRQYQSKRRIPELD